MVDRPTDLWDCGPAPPCAPCAAAEGCGFQRHLLLLPQQAPPSPGKAAGGGQAGRGRSEGSPAAAPARPGGSRRPAAPAPSAGEDDVGGQRVEEIEKEEEEKEGAMVGRWEWPLMIGTPVLAPPAGEEVDCSANLSVSR